MAAIVAAVAHRQHAGHRRQELGRRQGGQPAARGLVGFQPPHLRPQPQHLAEVPQYSQQQDQQDQAVQHRIVVECGDQHRRQHAGDDADHHQEDQHADQVARRACHRAFAVLEGAFTLDVHPVGRTVTILLPSARTKIRAEARHRRPARCVPPWRATGTFAGRWRIVGLSGRVGLHVETGRRRPAGRMPSVA